MGRAAANELAAAAAVTEMLTPAALIAVSEERDQWLGRVRQAWLEGFAAGERAHADDFEHGYATAVADIKRAQHGLVAAMHRGRVLWIVRGEKRTRETFGLPHKDDFPGLRGSGTEADSL